MPHEKQGALVRREDLFPAPEEQAHQKLEGFSRKQPDMGHRTTRGEAATPLHGTTRLGSLFFSHVTGQTKLNKPLLEKVHIGYRVAGKALLKPSLSEAGHYTEPHIQPVTHRLKLLEHVLTTSHCTPSASQRESSEPQSGALERKGWWHSCWGWHPSSVPQNHRTVLKWTPNPPGSCPAPSLGFSDRAEGIELGDKYPTIIILSLESNTSVASPKRRW